MVVKNKFSPKIAPKHVFLNFFILYVFICVFVMFCVKFWFFLYFFSAIYSRWKFQNWIFALLLLKIIDFTQNLKFEISTFNIWREKNLKKSKLDTKHHKYTYKHIRSEKTQEKYASVVFSRKTYFWQPFLCTFTIVNV